MSTFACRAALPRPPAPAHRIGPLVIVGLIVLGACSSSAGPGGDDAARPDGGSGGAGTGGRQGASGGGSATGGAPASGGATGSGGASATGGMTATGGANGTGGRAGTGGAAAGSGGRGGVNGTGGNGGTPAATGGTSGGGEFGFTYRKPGATDLDWLCTFRQGGADGHVYVRLNQTGTMTVGIATVPVYTAVLAQLSTSGSGAPSELANVQYDYGGGHHNDSLRFDDQGKTYKYYHSSFGFGFRSCQPMDCINIYAPGATAPLTDGCTSARALPEICVPIKSDGTHDPLIDRFMKCQGDTAKLAAPAPLSP
jgi:hypothetical protein